MHGRHLAAPRDDVCASCLSARLLPPLVCHGQLVKKTQPTSVFSVCPVQFCSLINANNVRNQDVEQGQ